jgi:hypothetical protein
LIGADYTQANYQSGHAQPTQQNVELLLGVQSQLSHFDRYALQSQFLTFPGITDFGHIRFTANTMLTVKLSNNFHLNFSFGDNFDRSATFKRAEECDRIAHRFGLAILTPYQRTPHSRPLLT